MVVKKIDPDVINTGRFTTLFYLMVDPLNHLLKWVRAGHDAALLYDPASENFEELYSAGLALGWDQNYQYEENERKDLTEGQIIFLGTDGIRETFNLIREPFGKAPLKEIIRHKAASSANEIMNHILEALDHFRQGQEPEDDVTLVVVKITDDARST